MAQKLVRAPDKLKEQLQTSAQRMGLTLNALMIQILWEWVNRNV